MIRIISFFAILLICNHGFSQFQKLSSTPLKASWFNCDPSKNIYAVSEGKFIKYSPSYSSFISYDLQKDGNPSYIDINCSNEIVLFFQNSGKIILLDSTLNPVMRPFFLEELGIYEVSMVFAAKDGGLWFYNYLNNSLTKLNRNFMPVVRSVNLNTYFQSPNIPNFIATYEDKIYINVPSSGILVLGPNGEYNTAIPLQGLPDFQIDGKIIYYFRDYIIHCYNIKTLKTKKIYIPDETGIINTYFHRNQLIILKKDSFSLYNHSINPSDNYN
jgi:hypothetical protein